MTTWRSGSTFFGDILLSHSGTFYHYEPLLLFLINQIRPDDGHRADEAVRIIKDLFKCDFSNLGETYLHI